MKFYIFDTKNSPRDGLQKTQKMIVFHRPFVAQGCQDAPTRPQGAPKMVQGDPKRVQDSPRQQWYVTIAALL